MPEKFCSTCRNTGFVVLRGKADTIDITKTRCPHCPQKPVPRPISPDRSNREIRRSIYRVILLALLLAAVGIELAILIGGMNG